MCTSTELWCADTAGVSLSGLSRANDTRTNIRPPIKIKLKQKTHLIIGLVLVDAEAAVTVVARAVHVGRGLAAVVGAVALEGVARVGGGRRLGLVVVSRPWM